MMMMMMMMITITVFVMQGSNDVKRLVVGDKNYHERCLRCQVAVVASLID